MSSTSVFPALAVTVRVAVTKGVILTIFLAIANFIIKIKIVQALLRKIRTTNPKIISKLYRTRIKFLFKLNFTTKHTTIKTSNLMRAARCILTILTSRARKWEMNSRRNRQRPKIW